MKRTDKMLGIHRQTIQNKAKTDELSHKEEEPPSKVGKSNNFTKD